MLRAIYSKPEGNKRIAIGGDCFFQFVEWDKYGKLSAESIHQFGSSAIDKNSKHYGDQSSMFAKMKMKQSYIDLDSIKIVSKKVFTGTP